MVDRVSIETDRMRTAGVSGSAGSKVILLGEHAVVYGNPALVVGRPSGITVRATPVYGPSELTIDKWHMSVVEGGTRREDKGFSNMMRACRRVLAQSEDWHVAFECVPHIPAKAGLGASASMAAACVRAVASLVGRPISMAQTVAVVQASEAVYHGNASGVDAHAVLQTGVMTFSRTMGVRTIHSEVPPLIVVDSGQGGSTDEMVQRFATRRKEMGNRARDQLETLQQLVNAGVNAVHQKDWKALGTAMRINQRILQGFGVSTTKLDDICLIADGMGAWGAKLTGAGGGGCAVVIAPKEQVRPIVDTMKTKGYRVIE